MVIVSSDESETDEEDEESSGTENSTSANSQDESSNTDSEDKSDDYAYCTNPYIITESKVKKPKDRFLKKAYKVPSKCTWSDTKKKLRPKKRVSSTKKMV